MNRKISQWFKQKNFTIFPFQRKTILAYQNNSSGIIYSSTGTGKTYAIWLAILNRYLSEKKKNSGLKVLWITPMRALAKDSALNLQIPLEDLAIDWKIGIRTGDTSAAIKAKQNKKLPEVLVTTPESLSLLLSYKASPELFSQLDCIVMDEWHELLGTKRGVQAELCVARLKKWRPQVKIWGLTATLANLSTAMYHLLGHKNGIIIEGLQKSPPKLNIIIPEKIEHFPWAGHLGLQQAPRLLPYLEAKKTTLIFVNTRSQAEQWYLRLLDLQPAWSGLMALHHSSIDKKTRQWVEDSLREGKLKIVVCTSSLDLGVDFSPVEQVVQIGSPKGIARLLQRAGRSQHSPKGESEIILLPTHAFEILEYEAAKTAIAEKAIEPRTPLKKSFDVLIQHLVTIALGTGFTEEGMFLEVISAPSFSNLSTREWRKILDFIVYGGQALTAYPSYRKVVNDEGFYHVLDKQIAYRHRMNIGTITSDAMVTVKFQRGKSIAQVEESFIQKLKPGDTFLINGRSVEYLRMHDLQVIVKLSKKRPKLIPRWLGGRLSLSSLLNHYLQGLIAQLHEFPEKIPYFKELLYIQKERSRIPLANELLIEQTKTKDGYHSFFFVFGGRLLNEILAILLAYRLTQRLGNTISIAVNDYGFDLCASTKLIFTQNLLKEILNSESIAEDLTSATNSTQLYQRHFRDIARIAGLVFSGYPGAQKSLRQIQASSTLLYKVLSQYDPESILLTQSKNEVFSDSLSLEHLIFFMKSLQNKQYYIHSCDKLTPFAFPLWVEMQRLTLSAEHLDDRIQRMLRIVDGN